MLTANLHSFFVYTFFGYFFIFPVVMAVLKLFSIRNPRQRMQAYLIAFLTPFIGYLLYQTVLTKRCLSGVYPQGFGWQLFGAICRLGVAGVAYFGPILVVMLILGFIKAIAGMIYVSRVRKSAVTPPETLLLNVSQIIQKQSQLLGVNVPDVLYCNRNGFAAFTTGLLHPVIIIQPMLMSELSQTELEAILTHELIHVRRRDTLWNWVLRSLRDVMFFSPLSKILLDRYLLENECLCDRETIALTGRPRSYAATLVKVWRLLLHHESFSAQLAVGFAEKKDDMEVRVTSVLDNTADNQTFPAGLFFVLLFSIFAGTVLYMGYIC